MEKPSARSWSTLVNSSFWGSLMPAVCVAVSDTAAHLLLGTGHSSTTRFGAMLTGAEETHGVCATVVLLY